MPYQSRWSISTPVISIPSFFFKSPTTSLPDAPIFIDCKRPGTHYLTLATFRSWSQRFAAGLIAAGLKKGDRVLLYSGNRLLFPVVMMGVVMAGGIFTAANPAFKSRELAYQLKNAEVTFLLAADISLPQVIQAASLVDIPVNRIFVFDDAPMDGIGDGRQAIRHWKCLIAESIAGETFGWEECEAKEEADRTVMLLYSSGTTGSPKGVQVSTFNLVANALQIINMQKYNGASYSLKSPLKSLCFLPMYHALGLVWFAFVAPKRRTCVYIVKKFDLLLMMECIQRFEIAEILAVPPVVVAMAKNTLIRAGKFKLGSATKVMCGAAPLGRDISEQLQQLWPDGKMKINQAWGTSESVSSSLFLIQLIYVSNVE